MISASRLLSGMLPSLKRSSEVLGYRYRIEIAGKGGRHIFVAIDRDKTVLTI